MFVSLCDQWGFLLMLQQALKMHEKKLLPTLHLLWQPGVVRLRDAEPLVALRTCHTLLALIAAAPDFMQARAERLVSGVF